MRYYGLYYVSADPLTARAMFNGGNVYRVHRQGTTHHDGAIYLTRSNAISRAKQYARLEEHTKEVRTYLGEWWQGVPRPVTTLQSED